MRQKEKGEKQMRDRVFVLVSWDNDEQQAFWDAIPAQSAKDAINAWEIVRGDYAVLVEALSPGGSFARAIARDLVRPSVRRARKEWKETCKLRSKEQGEPDLCAGCGKAYTDGDADEDYCKDCRSIRLKM